MENVVVSDSILYIGVNDYDLSMFEGQYPVKNGVSYNSYVILDEKVAVMDTADARVSKQWVTNLKNALQDRKPDYLVISHMEPDHAANIEAFAAEFPEAKLVGNAKTFGLLEQFFASDLKNRYLEVKDGETLNLGSHTLQFMLTPMVHWPEVMMTYETSEKVLFSADAFGKFSTLDTKEKWSIEARRYYYNIVGKYGPMVQKVLEKAKDMDIAMICPLHGPILSKDLDYYLRKYSIWAKYDVDKQGVLIVYASIYGHTKEAAERLAEYVRACGERRVVLIDLTQTDVSYALSDAFRYDRMVIAGVTYDGGLFPCVERFLNRLASKSYQRRGVGFIQNGSWGPLSASLAKKKLEEMKDITFIDPVVTIKSSMKEENQEELKALAKAITTRE